MTAIYNFRDIINFRCIASSFYRPIFTINMTHVTWAVSIKIFRIFIFKNHKMYRILEINKRKFSLGFFHIFDEINYSITNSIKTVDEFYIYCSCLGQKLLYSYGSDSNYFILIFQNDWQIIHQTFSFRLQHFFNLKLNVNTAVLNSKAVKKHID